MWIKTHGYDRSITNRVDESIAVKDVAYYHIRDKGMTFEQFTETFGIPDEAILKEDKYIYINLEKVDEKVREQWVGEKRRIKEIRLIESMKKTNTRSRSHTL